MTTIGFIGPSETNKRFAGPLLTTLRKQDYRCNSCNLLFSTDDLVELHHIDGNNRNYSKANLAALHRSCHQCQPIHGKNISASKRVIPK